MSVGIGGSNSSAMGTARTPMISEAIKQGAVLRALGELGDKLAQLQDRVGGLCNRLQPILAPTPGKEVGSQVQPSRPEGEIANRIDGYADFVSSLDMQLSELIGRLEI